MDKAKTDLDKNLKRAFQHILYVSQPTPDTPKTIEEIALDQDTLTSLDGTTVWKELADKGKAFEAARFDVKALQRNLRPNDYNKPLREIRDAFYQTPRLPLLPNAYDLLQRTIYNAVIAGELRLVNADGTDVSIDEPNQINLASEGLRLAKTRPKEPCAKCGRDDCDGTCSVPPPGEVCAKCGKADCNGKCAGDNRPPPPPAKTTAEVKLSILGSVDDTNREQLIDVLQALLDAVMDEKVTYLQTAIHMIAEGSAPDDIEKAAHAAGIAVSVKPKQG